jgi:hypothetical protein
VYRSDTWFTWLRIGETCAVAALPAVAFAQYGPVWEGAFVSATAVLVCAIAIRQWTRARLVIDHYEVTVLGPLRDWHLPRSSVVGARAKVTWYSWNRLAVPVTLFLQTADGSEVRVGAVQSMIPNVGIARTPLDLWIARSHPQHVADEINTQLADA